MSKQFEQLLVLYNQILATSTEVKNLILKEDYNEAISREAHKSQLVEKVTFLKKQLVLSEEEKQKINSVNEKILTQESEVLEGLKTLRQEVALKLQTTQKQSKLSNIYDNEMPNEGSICDYTSD